MTAKEMFCKYRHAKHKGEMLISLAQKNNCSIEEVRDAIVQTGFIDSRALNGAIHQARIIKKLQTKEKASAQTHITTDEAIGVIMAELNNIDRQIMILEKERTDILEKLERMCNNG